MRKTTKKLLVLVLSMVMILTVFCVSPNKMDVQAADQYSGLISYRTHVQNVGWQNYVHGGEMSGTSGRSLRLEGIQIKLDSSLSGSVVYRTHVQNVGWQDWVRNDQMAGTSGRSLRLEGIQIKLEGDVANMYDIAYRVHIQDYGWLDWAVNGGYAGSEGLSKRLEGIEIKLVPKGSMTNSLDAYMGEVIYQTHVQNIGWQSPKADGEMSGTSGRSLRLEGIQIKLGQPLKDKGYGIKYRTHIQNIGWQGYVSNWGMSGTSGRSLRLEAIGIELTGGTGEYDVFYRVHAQNIGWMGWAKNGELAGTSDKSYRLEAIQIVIVKKGERPSNSYRNIAQKSGYCYISNSQQLTGGATSAAPSQTPSSTPSTSGPGSTSGSDSTGGSGSTSGSSSSSGSGSSGGASSTSKYQHAPGYNKCTYASGGSHYSISGTLYGSDERTCLREHLAKCEEWKCSCGVKWIEKDGVIYDNGNLPDSEGWVMSYATSLTGSYKIKDNYYFRREIPVDYTYENSDNNCLVLKSGDDISYRVVNGNSFSEMSDFCGLKNDGDVNKFSYKVEGYGDGFDFNYFGGHDAGSVLANDNALPAYKEGAKNNVYHMISWNRKAYPDYQNAVVDVEEEILHYTSTGSKEYRLNFPNSCLDGRVKINIYYDGELIDSFFYESTYGTQHKEIYDAAEALDPSLSTAEKLDAMKGFIAQNYTYSEITCIGGANMLGWAARHNFGLYMGYAANTIGMEFEDWSLNEDENNVFVTNTGEFLGDVRYHQYTLAVNPKKLKNVDYGSHIYTAVPYTHLALLVYYDGKWTYWNAQGYK